MSNPLSLMARLATRCMPRTERKSRSWPIGTLRSPPSASTISNLSACTDRLCGVAGCEIGQKGVKRVCTIRTPQLAADGAVAQQSGDAGKRFQMIGPGGFRGQQQEDQVNRLIVNRLEGDRSLEAGEDAVELVEPGKLSMRDADPHPNTRRAQALTLDQHVKNRALMNPGYCRGAFGKLLQGLPFVCRAQLRHHAARCDQIGNFHGLARRSSCAVNARADSARANRR